MDVAAETGKLEKKKGKVMQQKEGVLKLMGIADYETKVPETVREENAEKVRAHY